MNIYDTVRREMEGSGSDVASIGRSALGRDLLCAHIGSYAGKQVILTAGIHARECYTALVALEQLNFAQKNGIARGGAYIIPLVNPDGALFFENGETGGSATLEGFVDRRREWKANADGTDLNCNFDARFGKGRGNVHFPSPHGCVGEYPESAPESGSLARFTRTISPSATVSYHCMGGELYWEFFQTGERRRRDSLFASAIAAHIGLRKVDGDLGSAGGYKDYCVEALHIPAVTAELIRSGEHPFSPSDYAEDIAANRDLPQFILDYLYWREV